MVGDAGQLAMIDANRDSQRTTTLSNNRAALAERGHWQEPGFPARTSPIRNAAPKALVVALQKSQL
jgi:hypothetical protein